MKRVKQRIFIFFKISTALGNYIFCGKTSKYDFHSLSLVRNSKNNKYQIVTSCIVPNLRPESIN